MAKQKTFFEKQKEVVLLIPKRSGGYNIILIPLAKKRIKLNQCPACALPKEKWKRRKDWTCCSADCTEIYWNDMVLCFDWKSLRAKVFKRDKYRCVECGSDGKNHTNYESIELDADHITPISLGGDEWDINNIQTLCTRCHKNKTKEDMSKIAIARREYKQKQKGQTFLCRVI